MNTEVDLAGRCFFSFDGKSVPYYDEVSETLTFEGQSIRLRYLRDGQPLTRELRVDDNGKIGVYPRRVLIRDLPLWGISISFKKLQFCESIECGGRLFAEKMGSYWGQLKLIFSPSTGAYKGVGGFKAIYDIFPDSWSWSTFWSITAFLSIMLGVLNLLPIPVLDGGHVMFLLFEMVSGRKPSDKFMEYAQTVGFFILSPWCYLPMVTIIFKAITG